MIEGYCANCFEPNKKAACPNCGYKGDPPEDNAILAPGTILNNKYYVGKKIGRGGFGITYLGFDDRLQLKVCIKEYFPDAVSTRANNSSKISAYTGDGYESFDYGKKKFLEEARTLARFNALPNIATIHDFFEENNTAYLVMEYLEGVTLSQMLKNNPYGKLTWEEAREIIIPVTTALCRVHEQGIIHRDIAPDNIFITRHSQIKLLDFGAARHAIGEKSQSLSVILKKGYAPPEQYSSRGKQGPWTDIYALGATIYKLLTGKTPPEAMDRMMGDELPSPRECGAVVSEPINRIIMQALNTDHKQRIESMGVFKQMLLDNDYHVIA